MNWALALLLVLGSVGAAPSKKNSISAKASTKTASPAKKSDKKADKKTSQKASKKTTKTVKKDPPSPPPRPDRAVSGVRSVPLEGGEYIAAQVVPTDLPGMGVRSERSFESGFSLLVVDQPSIALNPQMRWRWKSRKATYWGFDGVFSLFQTGHYLHVAPALWYDFLLRTDPMFTLTFGLMAAPAFSRGLPLNPVTGAVFGEMSLAFEIDDLASVRGQFRPGIVGGRFAYAMGFLIGFQFH